MNYTKALELSIKVWKEISELLRNAADPHQYSVDLFKKKAISQLLGKDEEFKLLDGHMLDDLKTTFYSCFLCYATKDKDSRINCDKCKAFYSKDGNCESSINSPYAMFREDRTQDNCQAVIRRLETTLALERIGDVSMLYINGEGELWERKPRGFLSDLSQYITPDIDYTGCHPVDEYFLRRAKEVKVGSGYFTKIPTPAKPVKIAPRVVKEKAELVDALIEGGYLPDGNVWSAPNTPTFFGNDMFDYCGKKPGKGYAWLPEWLTQK